MTNKRGQMAIFVIVAIAIAAFIQWRVTEMLRGRVRVETNGTPR